MLTTLIRRELLDNLMTFRFAAAILIMLLLVVANTFVLIKDYERRLEAYNTVLKTAASAITGIENLFGRKIERCPPTKSVEHFQCRVR